MLRSLEDFKSDVPLTLLMATGSQPSAQALNPCFNAWGSAPAHRQRTASTPRPAG